MHKIVFAVITCVALTGCVHQSATVETNGLVCSAWTPVTWSKKDTDRTIEEVKQNNARQKAWCKE